MTGASVCLRPSSWSLLERLVSTPWAALEWEGLRPGSHRMERRVDAFVVTTAEGTFVLQAECVDLAPAMEAFRLATSPGQAAPVVPLNPRARKQRTADDLLVGFEGHHVSIAVIGRSYAVRLAFGVDIESVVVEDVLIVGNRLGQVAYITVDGDLPGGLVVTRDVGCLSESGAPVTTVRYV